MRDIDYSSFVDEEERARTNGSVARPFESTERMRRASNGAVTTSREVEPSADGVAVAPVPEASLTGDGFGIPTPVADIRYSRRLASVAKRVFDVVVAAALLILLVPLLLVIALLIKLDSPGPVLFRSPRVGRKGHRFEMLKFRTMIDGANTQRDCLRHLSEAPDGLFKMQHDPRLTSVGGLLRAASLDEIPQLLQVLTGTMSLVGPRPLPPEEDALIGGAGLRLHARPGMTGPWQLAGSWRVPLTEMVELDDAYLTSWSFWGDVKLIGRTAAHVVGMRGV